MIDWDRPVEAIHPTEPTMAITHIHDWGNDQWPHCGVANAGHIYLSDDGICCRQVLGDMKDWHIRNVPESTQAPSPELVARMERLVRAVAERQPFGSSGWNDEALALLDQLPQPIDPDEAWAEAAMPDAASYGRNLVKLLLVQAIKHGRGGGK